MGGDRFTALDSWRGIAACMVALFHVRAYSHVAELELVRNAHLFVDFFFVLSGFIIAAAYQERLAAGFGVGRFMLLRFGRVYPLHFTMLLAFLLLGGASAERWDWVVVSLLLINGLGVHDPQFWGNVPSWSISTEFFAYLAFAFAVVALRGRVLRVLIAAAIAFAALLSMKGSIDATGYQLARCLYGFAAGAITWHLFRRWGSRLPAGTAAEVAAIAAVVGFVSVAGTGLWSIGAPIVFAAVVLVFASQSGATSRVLVRQPFVFLGAISYSIYMVHYFIAHRMLDGVMLASSLGIRAVHSLGTDKWAGDLVILLYLVSVVAVAAATYRLIEVPAREWFRRAASWPAPARVPVGSA